MEIGLNTEKPPHSQILPLKVRNHNKLGRTKLTQRRPTPTIQLCQQHRASQTIIDSQQRDRRLLFIQLDETIPKQKQLDIHRYHKQRLTFLPTNNRHWSRLLRH